MDKQILHFTANEQALTVDEPIKISTNKVNYIEAHFDLGTNWSGYDSIRAIWYNDFNCISTVLDSLGNCVVPFEVMKRKGNVKVNLVGSISEDDVLTDRLTSYPVVAVIVDCNAQITGANTSPITPSEFEQFARRVHTDADRAEQGASNAETSAQNASDSATSAHNSAESARDDKIAIEEAIAEVIQQIEDFEQVQVVVNTLPPSSQATSDFTNGVLTLGIPQGVKGDTGNGIQSIAKVSTSGLVDTYRITYTDEQTTTFTVTNGAKGDTGNGIQSIAKTSTVGLVDTYTITYTNGTTTTFTVTNGEKGDKGDTGEVSLSELEDATVVQTLSDNTPYNYRRTNNGNGAGVREYDEIVGASVGWNQLFHMRNGVDTTSGVTFTVTNGQTVALSGTSETIVYKPLPIENSIVGHVYYANSDTTNDSIMLYNDNGGVKAWAPNQEVVGKATASKTWFLRLRENVAYSETINPQLTDLTLALGSTIADYVYSLEQSTAGSGVTWLKAHFPKLFDNGYQPFDSGSIKSVSGLTAHEMVGKNLLNPNADVISGYFDSGGKLYGGTSNKIVVMPCLPNTPYTFTWNRIAKTTSSDDFAIFFFDDYPVAGVVGRRLNWSYTQNVGHVTSLPTSKYIAIKIANITNTYLDETIEASQLEFGSVATDFEPHESHTYPLDSSVTLRGQYKLNNGQLYVVGDVWKSDGEITRKYGTRAYQSGDESDATVVTDGTTTVYPLTTPTTESAPTYENPQWCDANGTEEYVGSELPVGHNTQYPMTLVDTMPSSNGTYEPRVTVTNGVRTITWQSV